jgi:hypothetical protein
MWGGSQTPWLNQGIEALIKQTVALLILLNPQQRYRVGQPPCALPQADGTKSPLRWDPALPA